MKKTVLFLILLMLCGFALNAQLNLKNGLVAYYPFNGNANDESGNQKHAIVFGATLTTDRFGVANKAYNFDGSSNYILTPVNSGFTNQISLCAWFKTAYNNYGGILTSRSSLNIATDITTDNYGHPGFHLSDGNANNQPYTGIGTSNAMNDNNWHLLVGTYDGTTIKLYADGVLQGSVTNTFTLAVNSYFKIGWDDLSGYYRYFSGKIDDICIYNRAITAQEVSFMFTQTTITTGNSVLSNENVTVSFDQSSNTITVNGIEDNAKISVINMSGKIVSIQHLSENQLNMNNVSKGVYLIKIETSKETMIRKIII